VPIGQSNGTFTTVNGTVFNGGLQKFMINYDNAGGRVFLTWNPRSWSLPRWC